MFGKKKDKKEKKSSKKETPGEEAFCPMDFGNIVREQEISAPEH
jgi:hypothetical protein